MSFLFPKAPTPPVPANTAIAAPTTNPFAAPSRSASSFIGAGSGLTAQRKPGLAKTSLIGGG